MLNTRIVAPLLIALMSLAACGKKDADATPKPAAPIAAVAPPAGTDWADTIARTDAGGYRLGNPEAPVKLVEYASLTCPHCRDFTAEADEPLRAYVKSGRLSWEFRPFLLSGMDVPPTLLAQCQGPQPFFKMIEQLYANQSVWVGKLVEMPKDDMARLQALPPEQQFAALTKASELDGFFRQRGLPQGRIDACLADRKAADALVALRDRATNEEKVTGTPTFFINGTQVENTASWDKLKPRLAAVLGE